jgi:hypothetical protein
MKLNRYLHKIHRIISWLLVPVMAAVIITGLVLPLILLLIAHVILAARIELMRFHIKGKAVDILLLILGIVLGLSAIYVDGRIPR